MEQREPTKLPTKGESVQVYEELGVPILFDPYNRQFHATIGAGRLAADLESPDFEKIVQRIRQRTLVEPVQAYRIYVSQAYGEERGFVGNVTVSKVEVIEHHQGRQDPYVARGEPGRYGVHADRATSYGPSDLYLPKPADLEALQALADELAAERERHQQAMRVLTGRVNERMNQIRKLTPSDVRYVQRTGEQVAVPGLETPTDEEIA